MFSLYSPKKVLPLALLFSCMFFGTMFFMMRPNNAETDYYVSLGISIVLGIFSIFLFTAQNKAIAAGFIENEYDEDEMSLGEVVQETGSYVVHIFLLVLTFFLAHQVAIPLLGAEFGMPFQVSFLGLDMNILTVGLNFFFLTWLFLGTAEVVLLDVSFWETLPYTLRFVFDNFLKTIGFLFAVALILFAIQMSWITTYTMNQMVTMPIKILVFAYLVALCNSMAVSFFAKNMNDVDEGDEEYEEDEENDE